MENTTNTELIVKFNGDISSVIEGLSGYAEMLTCNYAVITIPAENIEKLYNYNEIEYFELPKTVTRLLLQERNSTGVNFVQSEASYNLTGNGVLVGIIDSGIDYTHKDFINDDGTTRILSLWDQTVNGNPPEGFFGGTEYSQSQINEAINSDMPIEIVPEADIFGHGTAVAGIAAGNGRTSGGIERGVAPKSEIAVVKLGGSDDPRFSKTTEILKAIKYLCNVAQKANMPLSINISYGTSNGLHDGRSLFESCINTLCTNWKCCISVATGNEGSAGHHFYTELKKNTTQVIDFTLSGNIDGFYLVIAKNFSDEVDFELVSPDGGTSARITENQRLTVIRIGGANISAFYDLPTNNNSNQQVFFLFSAGNYAYKSGIWVLRAICKNIVSGKLNIWMPTVEEFGDETQFLRPTAEMTLTLPSTVENVISVGGYNSFINSFAEFSGNGRAYFKPDIVAPAVNIYTCKAGGGYDTYTGTSMAAPFVTGACALLMQWGIVNGNDPFLYGQKIKAFLTRGAMRSENIQYPNARWGYGTLNMKNTMAILDDILK